MAEFRMPALGADMESGVLRAWRRAAGERLRRGDIIAEVETEKGIIEVEVFVEGVIERLLVQPGESVPVGTVLALIGDADAAPIVAPAQAVAPHEAAVAQQEAPARAAEPAAGAQPEPHPATPSARQLARELAIDVGAVRGTGRHGAVTRADVSAMGATARPRVTPRARALAAELGVSLEGLSPSGPDGALVAADVERAAALRARAEPAPARDPADAMRHAIGAAMARSKREIPHYYVAHDIDLEPALEWLEAENRGRPVDRRLLPIALLLRAVVRALSVAPELNGAFVDGTARRSPEVHLGVAISLRGGGLVSPAILDASALGVDELMARFVDLVTRARTGGLRASELSAPTITVTALGDRGVDAVFPVIVPPQVAIVGFGAISARPFVVDGQVAARRGVHASLAADHRVSDGHRGGLFLAAVARALKEPAEP